MTQRETEGGALTSRAAWRLPRWQIFFLETVRGDRKGAGSFLVRCGLAAASTLYRAAVEAYVALPEMRVRKPLRLPARVISVGNLTAGGTGKTSACHLIARLLSQRGARVAILSRGYAGRRAGVVSEGKGPVMSPRQAGDEPYLTAAKLEGVAVIVGKDRCEAGRLACGKLSAQAIILDDGFQYLWLKKDREILLVDALDPFGGGPGRAGRLLPRGFLREPICHMRRAHEIWVTHSDLAHPAELASLQKKLREHHGAAPIRLSRHRPVSLRALGEDADVGIEEIRRKAVCALSAIGNPLAFEKTLERLGAKKVVPARFRDHHEFTGEELVQLDRELDGEVEAIVTTEKDSVRLPQVSLSRPVWVLEVSLEVEDAEEEIVERLLGEGRYAPG
jgi:tetraacyldisaccharide 4'-kinase